MTAFDSWAGHSQCAPVGAQDDSIADTLRRPSY